MTASDASVTRKLADLKAEAKHARDRYTLYRAKSWRQPKITSPVKLQELKRIWIIAQRRIERFQKSA